MSSSPPSSSSRGSPPHIAMQGGGGSAYPPRAPSLARTSASTAASSVPSPRLRSSFGRAYGGGVGWETNDIRSDLAAGWGGAGAVFRGNGGQGPDGSGCDGAAVDDGDDDMQDEWGWRLRDSAVHPVPSYLPVDPRCTRRVRLAPVPRGEDADMGMEGGEDRGDDGEGESHQSIEEVSLRISTACQKMSIHGIWDNRSSTATLSSMERVEMEISVYLGEDAPAASTAQQRPPSPPVLLVELQRRKGCSVTFHNYRRHLLDAAEGKFNPDNFNENDGLDKPLGRDRCNQPRATLERPSLSRPSSISRPGPTGRLEKPRLTRPGSVSRPSPTGERPTLARPGGIARPSPMGARPTLSPPASPGMNPPHSLRAPSFSADDACGPIPGLGLKTSGEEGEGIAEASSPPLARSDSRNDTVDKALKALNMAASLIKKDRVDARRLGMESLVLLTDPHRAGMETAKIASRVVLLGTAREETVYGREGDDDDDIDALFDESAGLGIRETLLELIMNDGEDEKMSSDVDGFEGIEKEFTDTLFNLCLTVLSNALHTIEESVKSGDDGQGGNRKPPPDTSPNRRRAATEPAPLSRRFIDDTNDAFGRDVLSSLIKILGQARTNPHDAYHSARCLGVLFKGCGNSHKARARRDLDAKRIIAAALEVGCRSHAKLEDASRVAMTALVTDDEDSLVEEERLEEEDAEETGVEGRSEINDETIQEVEGEQHQQQKEPPSVVESMSADSTERP